MEIADEGELIGHIYDAALDGSLWPDVLNALRRLVDCQAGALMHGTLQPVHITMKAAVGMDEALVGRAHEIFGNPADNPFIGHLPAFAVGRPVPRQVFVDDEAFEGLRIYREFFEPQDLFHDITTPVTVSPDDAVALYLGRSRNSGPLGDAEAKLLLPWIPHLQRALLIDRQLRMHQSGNRALVETLDRIDCGVMLADRNGAIIMANDAAEKILAEGDGLEIRDRLPVARSRADQGEMERAIAMATSGLGGDSLQIQRPSGARPYLLFTVPLSPMIAANWSAGPAAAIIFSDPARSMEPPSGLLAQLYGLSAAESAVAMAIIRGSGRAAVAEKLGISSNTVKTHLNRIFEKTGTRRQAELVRLLLAGSPAASGVCD